MQDLASRLLDLRERELHVVCLPDFFLDHFVPVPPFEAAVEQMRAVHDRGGGNWPTARQHFQAGGNAANTAHALARLGVKAHLVARTSPFGLVYLRETLGRAGVDLAHVKSDGHLAVTTALEFEPSHRNVMLNDPGSVADFGPDDLDENARTLIEGADAVLVANWTLARRHGTALAAETLRLARKGRALTYLDTGDPSARSADIPDLLDKVGSSPDLDVFAINENELRWYGGDGQVEEAAARFASKLSATLDVHTAEIAATFGRRGHAAVRTVRIQPLRATGAGDTWNAGNLVGHLLGLPPGERLHLANTVAALYLTAADALPPTLAQVADAVTKASLKA